MKYTAELTGSVLDWYVAKALNWQCERPQDGQFIDNNGKRRLVGYYGPTLRCAATTFNPSSEWAHCGPLIDQHSAIFTLSNGKVCAEILGANGVGDDHKEAICRAIVIARFGQSVDIPEYRSQP